jgi:hypothetical protein
LLQERNIGVSNNILTKHLPCQYCERTHARAVHARKSATKRKLYQLFIEPIEGREYVWGSACGKGLTLSWHHEMPIYRAPDGALNGAGGD